MFKFIMKKYIAILRGINVGGKRKILMADLRVLFNDLGYAEVQTYIQSGNVIFNADPKEDDLKISGKISQLSRNKPNICALPK